MWLASTASNPFRRPLLPTDRPTDLSLYPSAVRIVYSVHAVTPFNPAAPSALKLFSSLTTHYYNCYHHEHFWQILVRRVYNNTGATTKAYSAKLPFAGGHFNSLNPWRMLLDPNCNPRPGIPWHKLLSPPSNAFSPFSLYTFMWIPTVIKNKGTHVFVFHYLLLL